jgi:Retroviral aspartyl protease
MPVVLPRPVPSLGGRLFHYRPVVSVRLTSQRGSTLTDGLLDTGADYVVLRESLAIPLGIDLTGAEEGQIHLVGRPAPVRCRYVAVQIQISDGLRETYEWTAMVGFASTRLQYNLLGQAGCLEFFDADFRGADREVVLIPNAKLPGTQVAMPTRP